MKVNRKTNPLPLWAAFSPEYRPAGGTNNIFPG